MDDHSQNENDRVDENRQEDDEDFGDFGGFEGAEPEPNEGGAPPVQATASPWALFNTANSAGRPDLLCAQNRFPPYLDPSDIAGAPNAQPQNQPSADVNHVDHHPMNDFLGEQHNNLQIDQARIVENVLDGTLNNAASGGFPQHGLAEADIIANGRLPDIGLGSSPGHLFAGHGSAADGRPRPEAVPADGQRPLEPDLNVDVGREHANPVAEGRLVVEAEAARPIRDEREAIRDPQEQDDESRAERNLLEQQLSRLQDRNRLLEDELARSREELSTQRTRLQEMQRNHTEELEAVRRAGHDSLAVIVNEYKEQSRVAVLEQQEACQRRLVETVREQMEAFQQLLQTERETHARRVEEEREGLEVRLTEALQQEQSRQQERFDVFLREEGEKQRRAVEAAVETERQESERKIQEAIAAEQEAARSRLEEVRNEFSQSLEEEKARHEDALREAREEEQQRAKEAMSQMVAEERALGRQAMDEAIASARVDTRSYIEEQRQMDASVRRRHLASLDLFLESSRQQLALMMESDQPRPQQQQHQEAPAERQIEEDKDGM